ncbi:MAG: ERF family protein [Pseudomonadota bacterium]|nr:ERF family protein [Pseudomonadota bacterium]
MNRSETLTKLAEALAQAQAEIEGAHKASTNPHFRSKYADLGAVWDACRGPLTKHGLSVVQFPRSSDGCVELETVLMHKSGEWMSDTLRLPVGKQDAQGYGSAMTYARRYSLMAVVGIAPEDDDANAAVSGSAPSRVDTGRKSSAQAKRDGDFETIKAEIEAIKTPDELKQWGIRNKDRIAHLPKAFADPIRDAYAAHMEDLNSWLSDEAKEDIERTAA